MERAIFYALVFYCGIRLGGLVMPPGQALFEGCVFFSLGVLIAWYKNKREEGFPNKFNIPTRP